MTCLNWFRYLEADDLELNALPPLMLLKFFLTLAPSNLSILAMPVVLTYALKNFHLAATTVCM